MKRVALVPKSFVHSVCPIRFERNIEDIDHKNCVSHTSFEKLSDFVEC